MNFGTWIGLVVFFISLYILWQIKQLLLLLFTAIVLATSLNILVKSFQRRGIKRFNAVLLAMLALVFMIISCIWIVVPPFIDQLQDLGQLIPLGIERFELWIDIFSERLDPRIITLLPDTDDLNRQLQPLIERFLGGGLAVFYNSLGVLLGILLLLAITLMLLADPVTYRQGFKRLFPAFYRHRVEEILDLCGKGLEGWLVGILFNMVVIALLSFLVLFILGHSPGTIPSNVSGGDDVYSQHWSNLERCFANGDRIN